MIDKIRLDFNLTNQLQDFFFKSTMIFFIQFLLTVFMFYSAITNADNLDFEMPSFNQMTLRLISCYLFHLVNYRDVSDAFKRLKFLRQNPERFNKKYIVAAFVVCVYQFSTAISIEFINIVFMTR